MSKMVRISVTLITLCVSLLLAIQLVLFHQYAFAATWVYARKILHFNSLEDEKRLSAICRSLGHTECVLQATQNWLAKEPGNLSALSNLAMALTKLSRDEESMPYFRVYFAAGGNDRETTRAYAHALGRLGKIEESIPWLYQALAADLSNRELAAELLGNLQRCGRLAEALSLREQLAGLTHLSPIKATSVDLASEGVTNAVGPKDRAGAKGEEVSFPSIDNRTFVLPLSVSENTVHFVTADPEQKKTTLSADDLTKWQIKFARNGEAHGRVAAIHFGPVLVRDFEIDICNGCKSMIGSDVLLKANGRVDTRNKFAMLILSNDEK